MAALALALAVAVTAAAPASDHAAGARALLAAGDFAAAEQAARAALAELDSDAPAGSAAAADLIDVLVESLVTRGNARDPETLALAERAVSVRTALLGAEAAAASDSVLLLADVLRRRHELDAAEPLYSSAVAARERDFGRDSLETAEAVNGMANLLYDSGRFAEAADAYRSVLAVRESLLPPDHRDVGRALFNLGSARRRIGDLDSARATLLRALPIYEHSFGPDNIKVAGLLNNLGITLKSMGDYDGARRMFERALPIFDRELGADHPWVAGLANNTADLARKLGDLEGARKLFETSLAMRERRLGPDHRDVGQSLNNLGGLLREMGEPEQSRPLLERSLAIREKALGPNHDDVARTLQNLGETLYDLGELAEARTAFARALAICEQLHGPDHPLAADLLLGLSASTADADPAAARAAAERAVGIYREVFGDIHPRLARAWNALAELRFADGERSAALQAALLAESTGRRHLEATAPSLSEHEALRFAGFRISSRDLILSIAADGPVTSVERRQIWEAVFSSRGVVLESIRDRRLLLAESHRPEIGRLRDELQESARALAQLLVADTAGAGAGDRRTAVAAALERRDAAERALAAALPSARRPGHGAIALDDVAAALPAGAALVSYVRFRYRPRRPAVGATPSSDVSPAAARYVAFVVTRDGDPRMVPVGDANTVDRLVAAWADEVSRNPMDGPRTPAAALIAYREAGRTLRRQVWDPVARAVGGADLVLIVPDGRLHVVSWATLPVDADGYLVETGPLTHVLAAEREVLATPDRTHGHGLLAVGDPDFDAGALPDRDAAAPLPRFSRMSGARREAEAVAAIWDDGAASGAPSRAVVLTGPEATEPALRLQAPRRAVLHIATHGFRIDPAAGPTSASRRGVGGLAAAGSTPVALNDDLVGIALAGANSRSSSASADDDGILTAAEIAVLDLSGVDLAVLSSCASGTGSVHDTEGVLGLRRAFRSAGAATVVVSLWPVADEPTALWMTGFYRALLKARAGAPGAVRAASLGLLEHRRAALTSHPFAWGAFVSVGEWR